MKCPKCGYLGFESGDRCRNCGYEFSLSADKPDPFDRPLDPGPDESDSKPPFDLDRIIGADDASPVDDLPLFLPAQSDTDDRRVAPRRAAFAAEDAPLVNGTARPRAPLGVRRATPEVPRARPRPEKSSVHAETLFETGSGRATPATVIGRSQTAEPSGEMLASPVSRVLAALVDIALLAVLDASILYLTLRLLGLGTGHIFELPLLPLAAFFLLLNGGYFTAFTAVGGQSIGKMALGIRVISHEDSGVPIGRATLRTLACIVSALPLGAGFLPGVIGADRLTLHDRLAHTRVVRPSST
jgi:uncharacterized RDD family membrane protein YckC